MTALRKAAQRLLQAIDAALPYAPHRGEFDVVADAADDLRAALAEPVQEPVAWRVQRSDGAYELYFLKALAARAAECYSKRPPVEPLYTAPPQRQAEPEHKPDLLRRSRNLLSHPATWLEENRASREQLIEELDAALADDALERMAENERELGIQLQTHSAECWRWHHECAITRIQIMRTPLTEQQLEQATRDVWRNLPADFDYTTSSWVEVGIRYAERAHHIGDSPCAS